MKLLLKVCALVSSALVPSAALAAGKNAPKKPELVVYSYESFVSKWGPGPDIQAAFEKDCGCSLRWVNSEDGAALLTRLRMEGKKAKADVVVGLDSNLVAEAKATGLFEKPNLQVKEKLVVPADADPEGVFVPFDYGWFAFMQDTEKLKEAPKSLADLLENPAFRKKVLVQDPRTSTPGLGLLLWIRSVYGDKSAEALKKLAGQVLTVTKGWSEAYGLFTKGEAPLVLSYTTSEAYHRVEEKSERYRAVLFPEGHYLQVEVAGLMASSRQKDLARKFLSFVYDARFQSAVATKNWMYPVVDIASLQGLPTAFTQIAKPAKTLLEDSANVARNRKAWQNEWLGAFRKP